MNVNKQGAITSSTIMDFIIAIVLIVVLLLVGAVLLPLFGNASQTVANTGYTGTSLFDTDSGVIVLIFVVVLLLIVLVALFSLIKKKK